MSTSRNTCKNNPDCFCNICGAYTFKKFRLVVSDYVKQVYFENFGFNFDTRNKPWVPNMVCKPCIEVLRLWRNKKRPHFKYQTPMIWREPTNHIDDCYFCVVDVNGINKTNRSKWRYPNVNSVTKPVLYSSNMSEPHTSSSTEKYQEIEEEICALSDASEKSDFVPDASSEPQPFNQDELSALIRDLGLSKNRQRY
jgi:hypothetical protein